MLGAVLFLGLSFISRVSGGEKSRSARFGLSVRLWSDQLRPEQWGHVAWPVHAEGPRARPRLQGCVALVQTVGTWLDGRFQLPRVRQQIPTGVPRTVPPGMHTRGRVTGLGRVT